MIRNGLFRKGQLTAILATCISCLFAQNKPTSLVQVNAPVNTPVTTPAPYPAIATINSITIWEPMGKYTEASQVTSATSDHVKKGIQFLDGIGRPIQTVQWQASPVGKDIVGTVKYDQYGRESYKYLPYVQTTNATNNGGFKFEPFIEQKNFYQSAYTDASGNVMYAGEQVYYGHTTYDELSVNRVLKATAAGNNWEGNNKGIEKKYLVNVSSDAVQKWTIAMNSLFYTNNDVTTNIPSSSGPYSAGKLYKNVTKDENGKVVVEYKDKEGKVILKKVQVAESVASDFSGYTGFLSTYYIYDDYNQLRFVIPPLAVEAIQSNWVLTGNTNVINELCFRYEYDLKGRMIAKKVPGAGWVYMIYDVRDRLVFSQDANMRNNNQWITTLYDVFNRPVLTGMTTYSGTPAALQTAVTTQTATPSNPGSGLQMDIVLSSSSTGLHQAIQSITLDNGFESTGTDFTAEIASGPGGTDGETYIIDGVTVNKSPIPPGSNFIPLTKTFYDGYEWTTTTYTTSYNSYLDAGTNLHAETMPSQASTKTKALITGTKIRVLDNPNDLSAGSWLASTNFYDDDKRVIQSAIENYSGGTDISTSRYDFVGKVLSNYFLHNKPGSTAISIKTNFNFDIQGRLLEVWKTINNDDSKKALIAKNQYDAMGNLIRKELGKKRNTNATYSTTPLQQLDFTYNIRGWLKGINAGYAHPELVSGNNQADRYFGMELNYDWGFDNNQINGNISGIRWRSKGDGEQRAYGYAYDAANRLLKADFTQNNSGWNNSAGVDFSVGGDPATGGTIKYDANGNILEMWQKGLKITGSDWIDKMQYTYNDNTNKLKNVIDQQNDVNTKLGDFRSSSLYMTALGTKTNAALDYTYDANGNMKKDRNKDIGDGSNEGIVYNYLNLPQIITVRTTAGAVKGTINYVYDALGNKIQKQVNENGQQQKTTLYIAGAVYENDALQFFVHEEGRLRPTSNINSPFVYDYFIKDHLGNVRMVLTDELKVDIYPVASLEDSKVSIEDDYYTIDPSKIVLASTLDPDPPAYVNDNGIGNNPRDQTFEEANSTKFYELRKDANGAKMGLGMTLKVMAGDKIDIYGRSYYKDNTSGTSGNAALPIENILTAFLGAPGNVVGASGHSGVSGTQLNGLPGTTEGIQDLLDDQTDDNNLTPNKPKAYINYLFFDEQFNCVGKGFSRIGNQGEIYSHNDLHDLTVPKNGFVYIYCNNESPVSVYFDNLQVKHTRGSILEETHYYPFGLTMNGISARGLNGGSPINNKKYQEYELNNSFDINLYETFYRSHDPQLGKFWQIDPKPNFGESLYAAMSNNPISYYDLLGDTVKYADAKVQSMVEKYSKPTIKNKKGEDVRNKNYNEKFASIITKMESSVDNFVYSFDASSTSGLVSYDGNNINIRIADPGVEYGGGAEGILFEETKHADQVLNGKTFFTKKEDGSWTSSNNLANEVEAKLFAANELRIERTYDDPNSGLKIPTQLGYLRYDLSKVSERESFLQNGAQNVYVRGDNGKSGNVTIGAAYPTLINWHIQNPAAQRTKTDKFFGYPN